VWRGRCGNSGLRLDVQLRAASPWLELCLRVDWQQRHELLRLELPLAQAACRYAADTPGGVLERPAAAMNAREQARWEVPAISWLASQASAGGGLAVLLDGAQGVSADADRLGVSLLRAPTWPDPSADQGLQRIRLALMPCADGWREQAVPRQAQRFREPLWLRPAAQAEGTEVPLPLDLGSDALQLVQLQPLAQPGEAQLVLQNLSPQRQRLRWPEGWRARREGLGDGAFADAQEADGDLLRPWQLGRWRVSGEPFRRGAEGLVNPKPGEAQQHGEYGQGHGHGWGRRFHHNSRQASRGSGRGPYSNETDPVAREHSPSWLNAPAWEICFAPSTRSTARLFPAGEPLR
jgi:alpha-mannosidase